MRRRLAWDYMKSVPLPNHNDASWFTFLAAFQAARREPNQHERGRLYRRALVARHPEMAATFATLGYPL